MHRLRRWGAVAGAVGALWSLGLACRSGDDAPPSGHEREARSEVLRELMASREKMPDPQALQAQRRELQAELGQGQSVGQGGSGSEQPATNVHGLVAWVGDDELLVRDTGGVERDLRVDNTTRFHRGDREVSRRMVEKGAEVRVAYEVQQGEWVARDVDVLRLSTPPPTPPLEQR
ncbi:hypothetical protein [Hyalangium minutum]|uniref:Putative lipoprotein n=1 Tax=Hyalangium minutum TaxID=394096 RepID=A0A085WET7_9BACT|nr:hypothetical protein [Hyalangium minutum]KFE66200.1 putative lipoprotein [Hyalangium minutum]